MEPFLSQIFIMSCNFAPRSFAPCDGQLFPISQNSALFSLVGTIYGGDGRTTFGVPDLRGRSPIHQGNGAGLPPIRIGQKGGQSQTTLSLSNLPAHSHRAIMKIGPGQATTGVADEHYFAHETRGGTDVPDIYTLGLGRNPQLMANDAIQVSSAGGSIPFNNYHPFQAVNYCIAMQGLYPSRS